MVSLRHPLTIRATPVISRWDSVISLYFLQSPAVLAPVSLWLYFLHAFTWLVLSCSIALLMELVGASFCQD